MKEPGPGSAELSVGEPTVAILRPIVTRDGAVSSDDIRALTEWRNRFVGAFLTEFVASEARTERWLVDSVGRDDCRILFMVDDSEGRTVGQMGLAYINWETGRAEADAIVRGVEGPHGLMAQALETMWRWGRDVLGLSRLGVRVRSDNLAIDFYEKLGFRERRRVPLQRHRTAEGVRWVEDPSLAGSDLCLVYMELQEDGN